MILRSNVLKYDQTIFEKEIKNATDLPLDRKVRLIQRNKYTQPKIFSEKKFDEDIEG